MDDSLLDLIRSVPGMTTEEWAHNMDVRRRLGDVFDGMGRVDSVRRWSLGTRMGAG